MVRAAMLGDGRLRRFNDYDFIGYSQKTEGPHQSTAVRSKKQAHLPTIVALAAWAGDDRRYGGATPAARAAETLAFWAQNRVPAARGGVGMQSDLMFANCAALGRATPAVWEAVGPQDRARIDLAMQGLLVSAAWQNSDANPWVRAGDPRAERTLTGGDYSRNRVPNFTSSSAVMPFIVAAYLGTAEAEALPRRLRARNLRRGDPGGERRRRARRPRGDLRGRLDRRPAGAGPDRRRTRRRDPARGRLPPFRDRPRRGHPRRRARDRPDVGPPDRRRHRPRSGRPGAARRREAPGRDRRLRIRPIRGRAESAPGRDAQVGRLTDMAAWPQHAYAGRDGMATELDTRDGGTAGSGGGPRASMSYAAEGCSILLTACAVLAALDRLDRADHDLQEAFARQGRGVYDMRFRTAHGHRSFAKGGRLWAGMGTNSDWDEAEAESFQMPALFDIWDLQLAPWAAG